MPGSSFGQSFRVTTAGESHGPAQVVIIDGCPPGIPLTVDDLRHDLGRRRPGQSRLVTARQESDEPEILSGVFEDVTTGTPIAILIRNQDQRSRDYEALRDLYRPGHADQTYDAKYGRGDHRGGGRSSARETVARVAAGAVARKLIMRAFNGVVLGYVESVGGIVASIDDPAAVTIEQVEQLPDRSPNVVRCPDHGSAAEMASLIESVRLDQDSIGGVGVVVAKNVPAGLGEPVFDKIKADLAKALFSIPAVMGVEYGLGFECARKRGSECNDPFIGETDGSDQVRIRTRGNRHGGILGGISSGMPIVLRVAVKPTSSLPREQETVTRAGAPAVVSVHGRHDPCLLPRFVPIAEAMTAIVLADHWLRWRGQCGDSI
ncbi:MAG: chorismate synthase [Vicinamibacteria bacterium]|nr:chorismate synthase [Vicinamibacteria bacterium]